MISFVSIDLIAFFKVFTSGIDVSRKLREELGKVDYTRVCCVGMVFEKKQAGMIKQYANH